MSVEDIAHRHNYRPLHRIDWCHYIEVVERCDVCLHDRHAQLDRDPQDYGTLAFLRADDCSGCARLLARMNPVGSERL